MTHAKLEGVGEDELEALVETMLLAAHADEEFSEEERAHFARRIEALTGRPEGDEAIVRQVRELERRIAAEGRPARLAALPRRLPDPERRVVALELAVELMASDGLLRTSERELVLEVAEALAIEPDRAADVVRRHHP